MDQNKLVGGLEDFLNESLNLAKEYKGKVLYPEYGIPPTPPQEK